MEDAAHESAAREGPGGPFRALLARDGKAMLAAAAATLVVEGGLFASPAQAACPSAKRRWRP